MKKIIIGIIITLVLAAFGVFAYIYFNYEKETYQESILKNINEYFTINDYNIFGTHMNISGCFDNLINDSSNLSLVLKNKDSEITINSIFEEIDSKTCFYTSKKLNEGILLDELELGNYLLLVKGKDKYYTFKNNTSYDNLEYYTITKNNMNNKINTGFNQLEDKSYFEFKIEETTLPGNVYDITIDPGHGGKDPGSVVKYDGKEYYESNLNLTIALLLKSKLEESGLKVKLTREDDITLSPYGEEGRAVIPNKYKSKYLISLHLNSTINRLKYGGVEVYVPNDINYDFAKMLANNVAYSVSYSKNVSNKVLDGIYYKSMTSKDIEDAKLDMIEDGMTPYDIKEGIPYMYMIREVGGIKTGAYVDGRNDYYGVNKYYNSNIVAEPYLIELAYLNYADDIKKIIESPSIFSDAINNAILKYLKIS